MVPAYLNVRATGGAVESLAKDWREIQRVVEAPSYEEGVGVDGETEGLPSEEEWVLGQTNRPASSVVDGGWQGEPCKK